MKNILIIAAIFVVFSCTEKITDESKNQLFVIDSTIQVNINDTARINLGSFGDEEGAWLFLNPKNARYSEILRDLTLSYVYYEYAPQQTFTGSDTVGIILNRGSDGASQGVNDSLRICFVIQ